MGQRYMITFQSPQMSCVVRKLTQGTRLVETGRGFDRTDKLCAFRFFLRKPCCVNIEWEELQGPKPTPELLGH